MRVIAKSTREFILKHDDMVFMCPHPYYVDVSGKTHRIEWSLKMSDELPTGITQADVDQQFTETELEPCPFCGYTMPWSEGVIKAIIEDETICHPSGICCSGCGAYVVGGETVAEAIQAWSTRPTETKLRNQLHNQHEMATQNHDGWCKSNIKISELEAECQRHAMHILKYRIELKHLAEEWEEGESTHSAPYAHWRNGNQCAVELRHKIDDVMTHIQALENPPKEQDQ